MNVVRVKLTDEQLAVLQEMTDKLGVPQSEVIRRALQCLAEYHPSWDLNFPNPPMTPGRKKKGTAAK